MNKYALDKDTVINLIFKYFPDDYKITSLADNARTLYYWAKKYNKENTGFYMLGSMGQELSMGLGLSLGFKSKSRRCLVISSDGSMLSNTNSLFTIGVVKPENLVIIVLDNEMHRITGKQTTASKSISLAKVAKTCHLDSYEILNYKQLESCFKNINKIRNPIFIQVKINDKKATTENIKHPSSIFRQFCQYINL